MWPARHLEFETPGVVQPILHWQNVANGSFNVANGSFSYNYNLSFFLNRSIMEICSLFILHIINVISWI